MSSLLSGLVSTVRGDKAMRYVRDPTAAVYPTDQGIGRRVGSGRDIEVEDVELISVRHVRDVVNLLHRAGGCVEHCDEWAATRAVLYEECGIAAPLRLAAAPADSITLPFELAKYGHCACPRSTTTMPALGALLFAIGSNLRQDQRIGLASTPASRARPRSSTPAVSRWFL